MSIPNFTLRLALLPLLGTLVTAKALDYAVAQTEKSIVFDYAQITPQPEPAEKPVPVPTSEPTPAPQATPEPTSSQKTQAEEADPTPASKPASVEAPLPTEGAATPTVPLKSAMPSCAFRRALATVS